jgi:predicted TIM-barrel fold metal-dependent hydrolase
MAAYSGPIVDAHHHLWRYRADDYPWIGRSADPVLARDFLAAEYHAAAGDLPIAATVWIEAVAADPVAEAMTAQAVAAGDGRLCNAIVAHAPLDAPDIAARLDRLIEAVPNFRGVRDIVAARAGQGTFARPGARLDNPAFLAGIRELARRGLSFDLMLEAPQIEEAATRLRHTAPDLPIVIEHAGGPDLGDPADIQAWRRGLRAFAELPNITIKISALHCRLRAWTDEALLPVVAEIVETFGADRTMFASDFPVHDRHCPMRRAFATFRNTTANASPDEQAALFAATARRVYRI